MNWDDEVERGYSTLRSSFAAGKTRPLAWRREQLEQMKLMLKEGRQRLEASAKVDLHKCSTESYLMEINPVEHEVQTCLDHLDEWSAPESKPVNLLNLPGSCAVYKDPLGVVLVAGAWNYPIQLCLSPLAGAIAAGNCVMVKVPSVKYATQCSSTMAELIRKYLDSDCIHVVEGDRHAFTATLKLRFDHICFTGGLFVGKIVAEAAAKFLTPTTLELGGKSPLLVDQSADIVVAAKRYTWGALINCGQTCIRPDYCMVHFSVADKFIAACKKNIIEMFGDDASRSEVFGRLINQRAFDRVNGMVSKDKKYIAHGGSSDPDNAYVEPTLFDFGTDIQAFKKSGCMSEEIFGPLLPICRFHDFDECLDFIKEGEKPLVVHIFSTNKSTQERVLTETSSGQACVNDAILFMSNDALPFGGVGYSGMGNYHGKHTFEMFTHQKSVLKKHFIGDLPARYPPYTRGSQWLLNLLQYPYTRLHVYFIKAALFAMAIIVAKQAGVLEGIIRPLLNNFFSWGASVTSGNWR